MLLGLLLAYVPIWAINSLDFTSLNNKANRYAEILPLLLPAAVLVIPYVDMLRAVIRRTRAGMSPFAADRKHLHHTMLEVGHSHRSSVLILYAWAALFAGTVVGLSIVTVHLAVLIWITLAAILALALLSMPKLRWWERNRLDQAPVTGRADRSVGASESRAAIPLEVGVARGPAMPHGGGAGTEADARAEGGHPAGPAMAGTPRAGRRWATATTGRRTREPASRPIERRRLPNRPVQDRAPSSPDAGLPSLRFRRSASSHPLHSSRSVTWRGERRGACDIFHMQPQPVGCVARDTFARPDSTGFSLLSWRSPGGSQGHRYPARTGWPAGPPPVPPEFEN